MRALLLVVSLVACSGSSPRGGAAPAASAVCEPQQCYAEGVCDAIVIDAITWNGSECSYTELSGCRAVGKDCDKLYASREACETATRGCPNPVSAPDVE